MSSKRGQSLVEVVIALTILIIVLTSTVTLIISVVNLTVTARNKTEAVALAQKAIAAGTIQLSNACNISIPPDAGSLVNGYPYTSTNQKTVDVKIKKPSSASILSRNAGQFTDANFVVLESKVTWRERGQNYNYEIKHLVGK